MKFKLLTLSLLFCCATTFAQIQGDGGLPRSQKVLHANIIPTLHFSEPDVTALRQEDSLIDAQKAGPWRFGFNNETDITLTNSGSWINLPNGSKIWRVKLVCENALTVNLTLDNVSIPAGNELYVYNEDKSFILGKFTANHIYDGVLGTELVPGNTAIVEYYVPAENSINDASLRVMWVTHGYRTANEYMEKAFGSSGSCNMNVNCPDGDPWEPQKRGAVMLVSGGSGFCSGALINNTQNDGKPYVLTANHCYSNPVSWVFRFHWEAAACANPGSSPSFMSLSGAVLRARRTPSDFCLVEITGGLESGTVPAAYEPFFAGWDNSGTNPSTTVCIHHPAGDIKKISFDDAPASPIQAMGSSEPNSSWAVEWDRNTTTEGGSSGSPLYDQNGRIIGQLWGGGASCSNLSAPDYYGRVFNSWAPAGSNSTNQLKFWLDPNTTNVTVIDGYDPSNPTVADNSGINAITTPNGLTCAASFTPQVVVRNFGSNNLTSVIINYNIDGGANNTFNWSGNLAPGASETVTLPSMSAANGAHTFNAFTTMPNAVADNDANNDDASSTFNIVTNGQLVNVIVNTDCWGYETYWEIENESNVVVAFGGNEDLVMPGGQQDASPSDAGAYGDETTVTTALCLQDGCYEFTIYDDYGDGLDGTASGCDIDGSYSIENADSDVLAAIQTVDFGDSETNSFCLTSCASTFDIVASTLACFGDNDGTITVNFTTGNSVGATYDIGSGPQSSNTFTGLAAGNYTITILDGDACSSVEAVTLSQPAAVSSSLANASPSSGSNGSINVNVTGGSAPYTYEWTGPNGYTGNTEDISGLAPGTYNLTVTDACGNTSTVSNVVVGNSTGIEELNADYFVVYPNPSTGMVTLKFNAVVDGKYSIAVYDLAGRIVYFNESNAETELINLTNVAVGSYMISVRTEDSVSNKTIVIQK